MMMQFFQQRERKLKRIQADDPINFLQLMNKADIGAGEVGGRGLLIMGLTAVEVGGRVLLIMGLTAGEVGGRGLLIMGLTAGEVGGRVLLIMGLTAVGEHQELEHEDHILKHHVFCSYLCFSFIFRTSLS